MGGRWGVGFVGSVDRFSRPSTRPNPLTTSTQADQKTYNALLPAVLAEAPPAQRREAVEAFVRDLTRRGLQPDRVFWNTIIRFYAAQVSGWVCM